MQKVLYLGFVTEVLFFGGNDWKLQLNLSKVVVTVEKFKLESKITEKDSLKHTHINFI